MMYRAPVGGGRANKELGWVVIMTSKLVLVLVLGNNGKPVNIDG